MTLPLLVFFFAGLTWLSFVGKGLSYRGLGLPLVISPALAAAATLILILFWVIYRRRKGVDGRGESLAAASGFSPVLGLLLLAFLFSDARLYKWYFILGRGSLHLFWLCLPPVTAAAFLARKYWSSAKLLLLCLVAAQIFLAWKFISVTGGSPLYGDDHSSFLYRLHLFMESFPRIVFYNPFWNGGYISTELVSSGVVSLALPAFPFLKVWGPLAVYTPLLAAVFLFLVPLLTALSLRWTGSDGLEAVLGGILSLGVNRYVFLNLLTYGTAPSIFVSFLTVPLWLLLFDAVVRGRGGPTRVIASVAALNLMIFWPPSVIILAPFGAALLLTFRRLSARTGLFLTAVALITLGINLPWILDYLDSVPLVRFVSQPQPQSGETAGRFAVLSAYFRQANPVLLVFGVLGIISLPRERRIWMVPFVVFFTLLILISPDHWRRLQLHRMIVPLSFLLIIPAARTLSSLWKENGLLPAAVRGVAVTALLLGVVSTGKIYGNRGYERYRTINGGARETVDWFGKIGPEKGRLMFAGPTVHGYGGGHVAYLQALTGLEMMAGDFYHFDPTLTGYQLIPKAYRRNKAKLREYFNLFNISLVVTYQEAWVKKLESIPGVLLRSSLGSKKLYSTGISPEPFLQGKGRIDPRVGALGVTLEEPAKGAVLKYTFLEGLTSPEGAELFPYQAGPGIRLIGVKPGRTDKFTITLGD